MTPEQDETAQLLSKLKRLFKAAGLRYADIATRLGVSEMTVKRYLSGKGLTLEALQQLCEAVDVTVLELARLVSEENPRSPPLVTPEQEKRITADIILGTTFYLLNRGWQPDRVAKELKLDEVEITRYLTQLDRLGVLALFPHNRVRILRKMRSNMVRNTATFELVARRVHEHFDRLDLSDPSVTWTHGIARLSEASLSQVAKRLDRLRDEIFELGEQDLALPLDQVHWCTIFAAVRQVSIEMLLHENYQAPPAKGAAE